MMCPESYPGTEQERELVEALARLIVCHCSSLRRVKWIVVMQAAA